MANPLDSNTITSQLENSADNKFKAIPSPHPIKDIAVWHALTASEDWARMLFTRNIDKSEREIDVIINQLKFALKAALLRISESSKIDESFPTPQKTIGKAYIAATKLVLGGCEYSDIVRIFTSIHSGHSTIKEQANGFELIHKNASDMRYSALEMLNHGKEPSFDIGTYVYQSLSGKTHDQELTETLLRGVRISKGRVIYNYNPEGIFQLLNRVGQRDMIIPSEFSFAWGTGYETHALINSLLIRCIYHVLTISFAAEKFKIPGGFESSLVIQTNQQKLIEDLQLLADFPKDKILSFINALTYGQNCNTPDPALQTIISLKNADLLIPCIHTITSNIQRNILTLMARTEASSFDNQSHIFEKRMCKDLFLASKNWDLRASNKTLKTSQKKEEIDLIIVDDHSHSILLVEARWMLQPADPREVINRIETCNKKVAQLARKINFLKQNSHIIQDLFDVSKPGDEWSIYGVVVIDGFGGTLSTDPQLPIISHEALKIGFRSFSDIQKLHGWIQSLIWLPQPSVHFSMDQIKIETEVGTIIEPGFGLKTNALAYFDYITSSAKNDNLLS